MRARRSGSVCIIVLLAASMAGCTSLNPRQDMQRAHELVTERTGAEDAYDPASDHLVADKVRQLLEGGLTVDEAVQVALLNNRRLQSIFEGIAVSRADYVQSGLLSNPTVSLGILIPEGGGRNAVPVSLAQQVVDLWQIPVKRKIARSELEQAVLNAVREAVTTTADIRSRCYQVLALRRTLQIAQDNLRLALRTIDWARDRAGVTKTMDLDLTLAEANILDARDAIITTQQALETQEAALARALGLSRWPEPWTLVGELPAPGTLALDERVLVEAALQRRLDARAAALQAGTAWDSVRLEYLSIFPSVTIGPSFEQIEGRPLTERTVAADTLRSSIAAGQLTAPEIQSRAQRGQLRRQDIRTKFGPAIEAVLPIWDQNQAQIAKAKAQAMQRQKDLEDLLDQIVLEVRQAIIAARTTERLAAFRRNEKVPQAEQGLYWMRKAFETGEQDVPTLLAQEESLITQRNLYITALRDWATARAQLEAAIGGALPEVLGPISTRPAPPEPTSQAATRAAPTSAPEDAGPKAE